MISYPAVIENISFPCLDHRMHIHQRHQISPEELEGLESVLRLIKCVAENVKLVNFNQIVNVYRNEVSFYKCDF